MSKDEELLDLVMTLLLGVFLYLGVMVYLAA